VIFLKTTLYSFFVGGILALIGYVFWPVFSKKRYMKKVRNDIMARTNMCLKMFKNMLHRFGLI